MKKETSYCISKKYDFRQKKIFEIFLRLKNIYVMYTIYVILRSC